jgi:hypothetical protein
MDYCTKDLTQSWAVEYRCTQRWTIAWVLRAKGSRRLAAIPINHIDPSGFQKEEEPECRRLKGRVFDLGVQRSTFSASS